MSPYDTKHRTDMVVVTAFIKSMKSEPMISAELTHPEALKFAGEIVVAVQRQLARAAELRP